MANRKTTFLLRRSNIQDKIPDLTGLTIGELALNTADAKLYTIYTSGTTGATEVRQIGWDRLSIISGGTVSGNTIFTSGVTGNSFNISSLPTNNNSNTQILTRNSTTGNVEYRDVSSISGGGTSTGECNTSTATTVGLEYKKISTISGFTQGSYIIKSYVTTYSGETNYGFWERTIGIITTGGTPTITQTTEDFDNYISGFVPSQVVYTANTGNTLDVYISGVTGDYSWTSSYEIKGVDCYSSSIIGGSSEFTGGTVSGATNFTNGLTANTISSTTFTGDGSGLTNVTNPSSKLFSYYNFI
jgi:hypothetical protein